MYKALLLFFISGLCHAQSGWDLLATTQLKKGYDSFLNEEIDLPEFSDILIQKSGERITLEGYIIPLQQAVTQDYFVLSRFPFQSCFFCGAAGPETVAEVYSYKEFKFTDERVRVTGTLILNDDDPLRLFFILRECEVTTL